MIRGHTLGNGIEARFEYDGMILTCDDASIARLYEHICGDASVAEVTGDASKPSSVRFISIGRPPDESAPKGPRWFVLVPGILAGCVSLVVNIVGIVTICQWVMRHLA